jgi:type IV pilus assembly protein PilE
MSVTNGAAAGFTLVETLVVTALVAILAAVALPSYAAYVQRSRILDAVAKLSDLRARMEDYFLDQRTYVDARGACGVAPTAGASDPFSISCEATATTFRATASGRAAQGMADFAYAIDHVGVRETRSLPAGWSISAGCWTIRADGFCV